MALLGIANPPQRAAPGEELALEPVFLALQPLTEDDSVSVGVRWEGGTYEVKSDGTPALGAIPTLKWLRGWVVGDPHRLAVGTDAPSGQASMTVEVYDAFTLEPLHVLDERLVREGQGTFVKAGRLDISAP